MKKALTPATILLCTLLVCIFITPVLPVFKTYEKDSITIRPYGISGCEISCKNKKGLVKKYTSLTVSPSCRIKHYDFNGDGIDELYIFDENNHEIIDFSKDIPLRISDKEDFLPLKLKFTKNEASFTAYLENGQNFELFPKNAEGLYPEETAEITITDFNNDKIYEICLLQNIKNEKNENIYTVKTHKTFNGRYFTIPEIKVEEKTGMTPVSPIS